MTRYKTVTYARPPLPGLQQTGEQVMTFDLRPKPRTFKQRVLKIGRLTIPLSRWQAA